MRTSLRLALLACASLVALVVANAAWADYRPQLLVAGASHALNAPNAVVIGVAQTENEDPTAKIDISIQSGYQENFTQAAGATIGEVEGTVILRGLGGSKVDISGTVKVDNPANYTSNPCAPGLHTTVWVLDVTIAGTPFRVPIYVDDVTTVPGVSARIQLCLAGPVGTPNGTQLLSAVFVVNGVFTNPSAREVYTWSALFTPYVPNTATPNPGGTVEARALIPLPIRVTIAARKRGKFVTISGTISLPGSAVPARVEIWSGATARGLRRVARANVSRTGRFSYRRRAPKRGRFVFYQARIDTGFGDAMPFGGCSGVSRAPRGCVSATFTAIDLRSATVRVRLRRR